MSTATTTSILQAIRTRLLTFTPSATSTLAVLLGSTTTGSGSDGKLFFNQAPDSITSSGFWGILRLIDSQQDGFDGGAMVRGQCELILYGRPRSQQASVERMADVVMEAWRNWMYTETTGRCIAARDVTSRFAIPYEPPADRELVAIRLLLPFMATPTFLTG